MVKIVLLFFVFLRISLFAIGGAYSFLPLLERELVERYHWLTKEEFLDVLGIVRMLPGAISIQYATYTGYKIGGIPGILAANLGNFLASAVLIIVAWLFYAKYKDLPKVKLVFNAIQLTMFSMIIAVAFKLVKIEEVMRMKSLLIVAISFMLFVYTKVHPAIIIIGMGILGVILK